MTFLSSFIHLPYPSPLPYPPRLRTPRVSFSSVKSSGTLRQIIVMRKVNQKIGRKAAGCHSTTRPSYCTSLPKIFQCTTDSRPTAELPRIHSCFLCPAAFPRTWERNRHVKLVHGLSKKLEYVHSIHMSFYRMFTAYLAARKRTGARPLASRMEEPLRKRRKLSQPRLRWGIRRRRNHSSQQCIRVCTNPDADSKLRRRWNAHLALRRTRKKAVFDAV